MDSRRLGAKSLRRGFTLVELLVVLVVIGILAGLISAAVISARSYVILARMKTEIHDMEVALQNYRDRRGEFPPDFANSGNGTVQATVIGHLQKAYPRMVLNGTSVAQQWVDLRTKLATAGINLNLLDASTALPFWLGGLPEKDRNGLHYNQLAGFSANPVNPFDPALPSSPSRTDPVFRFNTARLDSIVLIPPTGLTTPTAYRYRPDTSSSTNRVPYVYFCARASFSMIGPGQIQYKGYRTDLQRWTVPNTVTTDEVGFLVVPYFKRTRRPNVDPSMDGSGEWYGRDTFQIICAGNDGLYGRWTWSGFVKSDGTNGPNAPHVPIRDNLTEVAHDDNVTTFGIIGDLR